ncbi:MAG: dihydrofolate reductase family protein [Candidatus Kryptoniota bacterium]
MRKLYLFDFITLDGFFEGPNSDISWHNVDDEFQEFAIDQLNETATLLFGRVTYQMMASYWQTDTAIKNDPIVAGKMTSLPKIVFSTTLAKTDWNNTRIVRENAQEEVSKLKSTPGKDIAILGSSDLAVSLMNENLIDELRIMVNPVVLGGGKTLFDGLDGRIHLRLLSTRTFRSGNVLLYYVPTEV